MHRLFIVDIKNTSITGPDLHYLRDVVRLKNDETFEILDNTGMVYKAKILKIGKENIEYSILSSSKEESEPRTKVTLAQGLPKSQKMDFIIEKCTELGVNKIIPMLSSRSVAKGEKLERWRKLAKEAAEQSRRGIIPAVTGLTYFSAVLKMRKQFDLALIPFEQEKETALKKVLASHPKNILIVIGPEGGFSPEEIEQAKASNFTPITLGKRILRTETAGLAALAAIFYALD